MLESLDTAAVLALAQALRRGGHKGERRDKKGRK
jgi:hypothetical protein